MTPIQVLKKHGHAIEVLNPSTGVHETDLHQIISTLNMARRETPRRYSNKQYLEMIGEVLGYDKEKGQEVSEEWSHVEMPHYVYAYLVYGLVEDYLKSNVRNVDSVYLNAITRAQKFIDVHGYVFATEAPPEPKLDAAGNVAPAKGDKKVLAKKVWNDNQGKSLTRGQWIELLMKEVGLTKGGASTYHNNLKNGVY